MAHPLFVGVDIAKLTFVAHIHGRKHSKTFSNDSEGFDKLVRWLGADSSQQIHVAMEATGRYHQHLANHLVSREIGTFVVNPKRLKNYARSQSRHSKTDAADAQLIATYLCKHVELLRPYKPAPEAMQRLQQLMRRCEQLKQQRKQERTRAKELQAVNDPTLDSCVRMQEFITQELKRLEQQLDELLKQDEQLHTNYKLLLSIPQVGKVLALTWLAEIDEQNFQWAKDITAWLGLAPLEYSSGTSVYRPGQISHGNIRLRQALYMGAMGALTNEQWEDWLEPQQARGKSGNKLLVALMDKLLRVCWGVLKHQQPFCPKTAFGA